MQYAALLLALGLAQSEKHNANSKLLVSMAAEFPYNQAAGVSSVKANAGNWCIMYPYVF
jgi:chitinase